jgi:hypothetical protein
MKTVADHVRALSEADRNLVLEGARRIVNDPVFRLVMDGLQADALLRLATLDPMAEQDIRQWQQRYQSLKQIDIEMANMVLAIPKVPKAVI